MTTTSPFMPSWRAAPRQTVKQLRLDTRRCYDHFAECQGRARVYEHGGHLASIVGTATVKELVDAT
ncbi:MAG TPA: hypothetical protein VFA16_00960, partial [Mycobacterium sp.]|uniref:hypothetical protein n=1 Tax=Mycobacterium sp. TaxID=1785 RepID=UPI002D513D32